MRFALDSNILVYAFIRDDEVKHQIASRIVIRSAELDAILPAQVLGEFLNVIRRKHPKHFEAATAQARRWQATLLVSDTSGDHMVSGAQLALRHKLQFWDAVIWQVARADHAVLFLTEDLQDGLYVNGMRVMNPFEPGNSAALDELLAESS